METKRKDPDISAEAGCKEDEIDPRQVVGVLLKEKKTILLTAAACLLVALLYLFFSTPLYEVKIQVKSGLKGWPKEDIVSWLKEKQYINLFPRPDKMELRKISALQYRQDRNGQIVTIFMYWPDPEEGRQFLEQFTRHWMDYYLKQFPDETIVLAKREIEQKIDELDQQLKSVQKIAMVQLENRIAEKNKLIELKKGDIEATKKEIEGKKALLRYFEQTCDKVMDNTNTLIKTRDELIIDGKQDDLSLLFLLNSIQQNISYADQVKRRLVETRSEILKDQNKINVLKNEIEEIQNSIAETKLQKAVELQGQKRYLEKQIKDLRYQLAHIGPIKVLGPGVSTLDPVKPKKSLILSIALVFGLFLGVFLAFLRTMILNDPAVSKD